MTEEKRIPLQQAEGAFHTGQLYDAYRFFGSHKTDKGVSFTLWAPNAVSVSVIGDFNRWDETAHPLSRIRSFWHTEIPRVPLGTRYKYCILGADGIKRWKADPYARFCELRPRTASVVYDTSDFIWDDEVWMEQRSLLYQQPLSIYEVHLGSWYPTEEQSYDNLVDQLIAHLHQYHYTHVELLPLTEHPFDGSWGYQATGYYAVTSRYGNPHDFQRFINKLHQAGFGVILDWVPGHFCKDAHGLYQFDGSFLYEYSQEVLRENQGWGTANFDVSKPEVRSFLISSAFYWLETFHIDGFRVDAVSNLLYLNYGKEDHCSPRNRDGGFENIEAVAFIKQLNHAVLAHFHNPIMIAEEATAWPLVTKPDYLGGLGFHYKWNMGWMNDILEYMSLDPYFRKFHHRLLTFSLMYAFSENYILPLSHDEVVHGKRSLLNKMPGSYEEKFANLRLFFTYMIAHPGKKLSFMGNEIGQFAEWDYAKWVEWDLLKYPSHDGFSQFMQALQNLYLSHSAFWEQDHTPDGFSWVSHENAQESIVSFLRKGEDSQNFLLCIFNFTPVERPRYPVGVHRFVEYREVFNSNHRSFGGNCREHTKTMRPCMGEQDHCPFYIEVDLPPLGALILQPIFGKLV